MQFIQEMVLMEPDDQSDHYTSVSIFKNYVTMSIKAAQSDIESDAPDADE